MSLDGRAATAVEDIARDVLAAAPTLGAVRLVVIDGPAGSGKTTLAARLAAALHPAVVVPMDDLYEGWTGLTFDVWARLETQVLAPLRSGRPGSYQRYDWAAGAFAEWVPVPRSPVLIIEGVGAAARPVDPWATLRLWVEAPPRLRLERGIARAGETQRAEWVRWSQLEDEHFAVDATRARADVLVDGTA